MAQFSLSPAVIVSENDQSQYIGNPSSSRTGFVVCAETGYCNKKLPFGNEGDLLSLFGKPTDYNYLDWFNAWNFTQYTSNGFAVRPMNKTVKNAGVAITGSSVTTISQGDLYNSDIAEITLQGDVSPSNRLSFFNRYVTPSQKIGVAVCSGSTYWKSPIANEFYGVVSRDGSTAATINNIGGTNLVAGEIKMSGNISLVPGSKIVLNGQRIATVKNVYSDKILVNTSLIAADISTYYGTPVSNQTIDTTGATVDITFDGSEIFNIQKYSIFYILDALFYVSNVSTATNPVVTFTKIGTSTGDDTYAMPTATLNSNTEYRFFTPSSDYLVSSNYVVAAGTSTIKIETDFNIPVGSFIKFSKNNDKYTNLVSDTYPEEAGSLADNYEVISIDVLNNTLTLDRGLEYPMEVATSTTLDDVFTSITTLHGINLYSTVFDDSIILKTPITGTDLATGDTVTINKESLISFSNMFDYEPNWINDQFVAIILQKNNIGKYEIVDKNLASYSPTGRDHTNSNIFGDEVFYYKSKYVYCKVTLDETLPKANTANGPIAKFVSDFGSGTGSNYTYGTVYPLQKDTNGDIVISTSTNTGVYDPNAYTQADIQFAEDEFSDAETFNIDILVAHKLNMNGMSTISENRKDCVAIVTPYDFSKMVGKSASEVTDYLCEAFGTQTDSVNKIFNTFGTYSGIWGNMKYQYDKFNDKNRWMSIGGDKAGLMAQTDANKDSWWASEGLDRGKIKNCIKLAFAPKKQHRDLLASNGINNVIPILGEGAGISFGNKTATNKPSAIDRMNVRRLLIYIEKAVATAVKYALFEFNDPFTRSKLVGLIDPFLRTVKARRGVVLYNVKCDKDNNTDDVIEHNGLVIDVSVLPNKTAETIFLNINVFGNSVTFNESVGKPVA